MQTTQCDAFLPTRSPDTLFYKKSFVPDFVNNPLVVDKECAVTLEKDHTLVLAEIFSVFDEQRGYISFSDLTCCMEGFSEERIAALDSAYEAVCRLILLEKLGILPFADALARLSQVFYADSFCVVYLWNIINHTQITDTLPNRYRISNLTSFINNLLEILGKYQNNELICSIINSLLYTRPAKNWATCDFDQLCTGFTSSRILLENGLYPFMQLSAAALNFVSHVHKQDIAAFFSIWPNVKAALANSAASKESPECHKHLVNGCDYRTELAVDPLPAVINGLVLNQVSNAIVPFFSGKDELDIPVYLVPEDVSLWEKLFVIYNIPPRKKLIPECRDIVDTLNPACSDFPLLFSKRMQVIYSGTTMLSEWLPDYCDTGEDYRLHTFYNL